MDYKLYHLDSGLRVLTVPMPGVESATVAVWVKTGSRNEEEKVSGISHFLEHMVFKGSIKRPTAKEISSAVDSIGESLMPPPPKIGPIFILKPELVI